MAFVREIKVNHYPDALRGAGYEVYEAADGVSGLEAFRHHQPNLVIVDYFMPGKGGLEVIQAIREQKSESKIIAVTGFEAGFEKVREAGVDDVLIKPFDVRVLLEKVKGVLVNYVP